MKEIEIVATMAVFLVMWGWIFVWWCKYPEAMESLMSFKWDIYSATLLWGWHLIALYFLYRLASF